MRRGTQRRSGVGLVVVGLMTLAVVATPPLVAETVTARGLRLDLPPSWRLEVPSSSMRLLQAAVPGDGRFTVFHFGAGGGGGVEANIERWISQMELDAGSEPSREDFAQGDLHVYWVSAAGILKASRIGSFPRTDQPDYQLFGAVVVGEGGPWFLRLIGPRAALTTQRQAFRDMLGRLRVGD